MWEGTSLSESFASYYATLSLGPTSQLNLSFFPLLLLLSSSLFSTFLFSLLSFVLYHFPPLQISLFLFPSFSFYIFNYFSFFSFFKFSFPTTFCLVLQITFKFVKISPPYLKLIFFFKQNYVFIGILFK